MTNGARHGLGALIGLVATPVLLAWFGLLADREYEWRTRIMVRYITKGTGGQGLVLILLLVVTAVLLGALCMRRLSPLASLIPGVVLGVVNAVWLVDPYSVMKSIGGSGGRLWLMHFFDLLSTGLVLLAGGVLVAMSAAPGRWRGRDDAPVVRANEAFSMVGWPGGPEHPGPATPGHGMPGYGMPGPSGTPGSGTPGMPGPGATGAGAPGPGASPGPFGHPPAYPPAPPPQD
ncbi:hypothetical protein DZF91_16435, partial [Actinomadura logoneensis]